MAIRQASRAEGCYFGESTGSRAGSTAESKLKLIRRAGGRNPTPRAPLTFVIYNARDLLLLKLRAT